MTRECHNDETVFFFIDNVVLQPSKLNGKVLLFLPGPTQRVCEVCDHTRHLVTRAPTNIRNMQKKYYKKYWIGIFFKHSLLVLVCFTPVKFILNNTPSTTIMQITVYSSRRKLFFSWGLLRVKKRSNLYLNSDSRTLNFHMSSDFSIVYQRKRNLKLLTFKIYRSTWTCRTKSSSFHCKKLISTLTVFTTILY